ncbi:tetratricopeptide repeat protein [Methanobacterium sp.]|uniref:tetratricopeptide repeat protein n=1 Tax=Methanobacterium sp. TaxID=2164 RepID=UPI003C724C79
MNCKGGKKLKFLQVTGIFDSLKKKENSIEEYKAKLQECKETEAYLLMDIGILFSEEENFDEAIEYMMKSLEVYRELKNTENEAFVLNMIGDIYLGIREVSVALKYYSESFKLYSSIKSPLKKEMFKKIKEVEQIKDALEIVKTEREREAKFKHDMDDEYIPNYKKIGTKLENVIKMLESARAYEIYSKEENPMKHLQEIYNTSREIGDLKGEAISLLLIGDTYLKIEKTRTALKCFNDAYDIFHNLEDEKGQSISLILIGTVHFIHGDMDKVSVNFRNAIQIFRKLNDTHAESVTVDLLNEL